MKNILVVSVNWLGDAVFSTPVFRALKENYPGVRVVCLAVPRVKEVLLMCPWVDEVIVYDEDGVDRPLIPKIALVARLRRYSFDAVFVLRKSLSRSLIVALAGIPLRVGYASKSWQCLLSSVVSPDGMDEIHRSDVYLRVIETVGIKVRDRSSALSAGEDVVRGWKDRLSAMGVESGGRVIALNTGGNWDLKQWPLERFAELIKEIYARKLGTVVLPGAEKDVERVQKIASLSGESPLVVAGETGIRCLAGLLSCVDVLVTADSGPMHVASALGTRVVGVFGPTRPEITGPRGQGAVTVLQKDVGCNKAPCYYLECQNNKCMKAITVNDVLQALQTS